VCDALAMKGGRESLLATTQRPLNKLRPLAQAALADSPIFDMRMLTVEVAEDTLVLSGSVSSFYHKQMAQELVRTIVGRDVEVINSIAVREHA
jgi:osmotically-inducible protein OsmY